MKLLVGLLLALLLTGAAGAADARRPVTQVRAVVSWQNGSNHADGFRVYRRTGTRGSFAIVGVVMLPGTTFTDAGIKPNTTYTYKVGAFNQWNEIVGPETVVKSPRR